MADPAESSADTLKYKGVRKRKWGKWVSEVRLPNSRERIWLGSYDSPEKAARAFDAASFLLRGDNASLNFPDRTREIAVHCNRRNPTPQQIQAAAARYAYAASPPLQPPQSVSQAAEDSAPSATTEEWEFMEQMMAPTFPGIDEFHYEWLQFEEEVEQQDLGMENCTCPSLWNF